MIFQHTWQQVLAGKKTQTRRLVKKGDELKCGRFGSRIARVCRNGRTVYRVGKTIAVQPGRGKKAVGRVRITQIRKQRIKDIIEEDIHAEGVPFGFRQTFHGLWERIHPGSWQRNDWVYALTFEWVKDSPQRAQSDAEELNSVRTSASCAVK